MLANAIEMPRLLAEELEGLDYEPIEYPWTDDQDPARAVARGAKRARRERHARRRLAAARTSGCSRRRCRARASLLTDGDIARYRALGRDAGLMLGNVCRALTPGDDERDIARAIMDGAAGLRARPIVTLVGSDERLRRFRHPVPTASPWRAGGHVSRSAPSATGWSCRCRASSSAGAPGDLDARTRATAHGLRPPARRDASGRDRRAQLYAVAADAYADAGFPGEELKHHQGGAIGYRAREWVAHPNSQESVQARQAFAWNPTITGTKVEDTALVIDDRLEMLTTTPDWPVIDIGRRSRASGVWRL